MKRRTLFTAAVLVMTSVLSAQEAWKLDRSHANIGFSVTHMLISEVPGSFQDFDIVFAASEDDFSDALVTATINVASITTDNERRDSHLRSDDFFDAETYPTITFVSTQFEKVDDTNYKIHGDLTIRDVTKPVVFDARLMGVITTQRGTLSGWKASLVIDRFDYNIAWDRTLDTGGLVVSKEVAIELNAKFRMPVKVDG